MITVFKIDGENCTIETTDKNDRTNILKLAEMCFNTNERIYDTLEITDTIEYENTRLEESTSLLVVIGNSLASEVNLKLNTGFDIKLSGNLSGYSEIAINLSDKQYTSNKYLDIEFIGRIDRNTLLYEANNKVSIHNGKTIDLGEYYIKYSKGKLVVVINHKQVLNKYIGSYDSEYIELERLIDELDLACITE